MDECNEIEDSIDQHFKYDLSPGQYAAVSAKKYCTSKQTWPALGSIIVKSLEVSEPDDKHSKNLIDAEVATHPNISRLPSNINSTDLEKFHIKSKIIQNAFNCNLVHSGEQNLSSLQLELLSIIYEYRDLYFTRRTFSNAEQIRFIYCLHAINHALKVRLKILNHNTKISNESDIVDEYRDQGLVRPRVLILVPFKESALRVIKMLSSIFLGEGEQNIVHKKRFLDEFGGDHISVSQKRSRPEDYEQTFAGNIDDNFKIGISMTKRSLKLYADFYSSDIIVASPLGLRMIIKAEGEVDRDYDFLSSIELLIIDQCEILLMQNWDHVLHTIEHLNLQPTQSRGTDISRVRSWAINGWTKYYRQNLIFTAYPLVQISAMVNDLSNNYMGCARTNNVITLGTINQVIVPVSQIFYRINAESASSAIDERFNTFLQKILPQCQDNLMTHVLVYVPSYFDFVRLRNYFKTEAISFMPVCEYSKDKKVAEARDKFFHNEVNYMLYSERFHFFMRRKIRGIRHLVFYQPPTLPHFYSEMCNLMQESNQNPKYSKNMSTSVSVIYSKYDAPQLAAIVSTNDAARMLSSNNEVHLFKTENS